MWNDFGFKFDIPKDHQRPEVGKAKFQPSLGKFTGWFSRLAMSFLKYKSNHSTLQHPQRIRVFIIHRLIWFVQNEPGTVESDWQINWCYPKCWDKPTSIIKHLRQSISMAFYGILWHTFCQVCAKHLPVACTARGNGKLDFSGVFASRASFWFSLLAKYFTFLEMVSGKICSDPR